MKESEQGRVCEAAPSLKCVSPFGFRVPPAICCARATRAGWGGGCPSLGPGGCRRGAERALGTVCCCLGWHCSGLWGWCRQKLAKVKVEGVRKSEQSLEAPAGHRRDGMTLNVGEGAGCFRPRGDGPVFRAPSSQKRRRQNPLETDQKGHCDSIPPSPSARRLPGARSAHFAPRPGHPYSCACSWFWVYIYSEPAS